MTQELPMLDENSLTSRWRRPGMRRDLLYSVMTSVAIGAKTMMVNASVSVVPATSESPTHRDTELHAQVCNLLELYN